MPLMRSCFFFYDFYKAWPGREYVFNPFSVADKNTDTFVNSVDLDTTAHNKPYNQDLHCLEFCFGILTGTPICSSGHVRIQSRKSPFQKLRGEKR